MPCSSRIYRALPPFGPPDGMRRCRLLLAVVRGTQPRGGWCSSVIARLQGFSSCSPAAISRQWSSRGMTTSLVLERSEPGCGLPPAVSFKDVHHPRWGGGRAELGPRILHGLAAHFFLQHSGEKGVRQSCEEANFGYAGPADCRCRQPPRARYLGLGGFGAASDAASYCLDGVWLSVHRMGDGRAVRRSATSTASLAPSALPGGRPRRRALRGWWPRSWMVLSSLPQ
jgi:hypothetical protein